MRSISLALWMHSIEFRELRQNAAAHFCKLSFCARHVSQQCVQLLWTQDQQSEHDYEQELCNHNAFGKIDVDLPAQEIR